MKTKLLQSMTKIKPALVLAVLLLFLGAMLPLQAQNDTLGKNPHLYYYQMPELGHHDTTTCYIDTEFTGFDYARLSMLLGLNMNICADEYALYMHSDDTIQIVGIAFVGWQGAWGAYRMSLYDDTMRCLASAEVPEHRPAILDLDSNWLPIFIPNYINHGDYEFYNMPNLALRLAFFDDTIAVSGGFYLGSTYISDGAYYSGPILFLYENHPAPYTFPAYSARVHDMASKEWIDFEMTTWCIGTPVIPLIFPILSSYPRSTDTTGVAGVAVADRQVGLSPNPATGRVQVTASCGMTEVAVYSATGEQVLRQPASGHSATLDAGRWPAGVYIVHVETPLGRAVKKLVVR